MNKQRGWFNTSIRDGDRSLGEQMTGLEQVVSEAPGKTVLDCGCAEGLISFELAKAGAASCLGLEAVRRHLDAARALNGELPCTFERVDLNDFSLPAEKTFDIVLLLAILHKLHDPSAVCAMFAAACTDLCVIRLPPSGPVINDPRSLNVPHDIAAVMKAAGFVLERETVGPRSEWLAYFRRQKAAVPAPEPRAEPEPEPEPERAAEAEPESAVAPVSAEPDASLPPAEERTRRARRPANQVAPMMHGDFTQPDEHRTIDPVA